LIPRSLRDIIYVPICLLAQHQPFSSLVHPSPQVRESYSLRTDNYCNIPPLFAAKRMWSFETVTWRRNKDIADKKMLQNNAGRGTMSADKRRYLARPEQSNASWGSNGSPARKRRFIADTCSTHNAIRTFRIDAEIHGGDADFWSLQDRQWKELGESR